MSGISSARVKLSRDPPGYRVGQQFREGFPDDPQLPEAQRRRVAGWARALAPGQMTAEQQSLLDTTAPISKAQKEAERLAGYQESPFWRHLSREDRALVKDPNRHPQLSGIEYPLRVGQLATLVGASGDQIRRWHDLGLLPARRTQGKHRKFYEAAAARALFVAGLGQLGIAILQKVRTGDAGPLLVGLSTVFADEAEDAAPEQRSLLLQTAERLQEVSDLPRRRRAPVGAR